MNKMPKGLFFTHKLFLSLNCSSPVSHNDIDCYWSCNSPLRMGVILKALSAVCFDSASHFLIVAYEGASFASVATISV